MAESIVTLRVEARNAISSLNKTSLATKQLSTNAKGATASLTAASTAAKGLGASLAASLGPLITVGAAVATVSNAIRTFSDRERDVTILRQGLENLGAGTIALNELQEAADRLGNQTLFNQEEFTRGFNLLTSFRKIGVDSYERVAQAAADIAQVNQVDVSTSFMQLAKALQDPERNLANLNRSGIAFTKQQTEVIKQLMKTNKVAEAHAMILDIVDESYNKLAQAAAGGFAGSVDTLGESFRDFSEVLGKALVPVIEPVVKGLTQLLTFLTTEGGQAVLILTTLGGAAKALSLTLPALSAGMIAVAKAGGILTIALNAIPFVAIATGVGLLTTAILKQKNAQKELNDAINTGSEAQVNEAIEKQDELLQSINARLENAHGRKKKNLEAQKEEIEADKRLLEGRLITLESDKLINDKLKERNELHKKNKEEIDKQKTATDELREKMTSVGQEIESSIKNNLKDAITGAKTFGEAMSGVLNKIRDKLMDKVFDNLFSGFADNFGKSASGGKGGGIGGFIGGLFGFADGGTPPVGRPSIVGERGPELFVPRSAGTIVPNEKIGGSNITNNISINVDATNSNVQSDGDGQQFGQALASAIQAEIVKQKRSGGLLR